MKKIKFGFSIRKCFYEIISSIIVSILFHITIGLTVPVLITFILMTAVSCLVTIEKTEETNF